MSSFVSPSSGAGVLSEILKQNNVYLGGSAMGKGFRRAARYYLQTMDEGATSNNFSLEHIPEDDSPFQPAIPAAEESFYVVDIGVVVSQYNEWRERFSRVECFYAIKCNPDPVLIQALAVLGANFDCASKQEIELVCSLTKDLPRQPEILYANPCKARSHIAEAVQRGVTLMTFDNVDEVVKCASISRNIRLILRIITDDSGSLCRLSTKYGAPRGKWRDLLAAAKQYGLQVVGVSFHVGSGCRDATRYDLALQDAKEVLEIARNEFGFDANILDIGGGFPGETHSLWNPAARDPVKVNEDEKKEEQGPSQFMFFDEIAAHVSSALDEMFPPESTPGLRLIAEPGRYLVAASCTLLTNVIAVRSNIIDETHDTVTPISDAKVSAALNAMTREQENVIVREQGIAEDQDLAKEVVDEISEYARLFARQSLSQQEVETYTHRRDFSASNLGGSTRLLSPPEDWLPAGVEATRYHTAEGVVSSIVADCLADIVDEKEASAVQALAAAGEAAVAGVIMQSVADSVPIQDDFSYYVNDGVYGAFNNLIFDHATVRARPLRNSTLNVSSRGRTRSVSVSDTSEGFHTLKYDDPETSSEEDGQDDLYTSTVFGPTCDSIDVISHSILLPKLNIGDWLYFNNMGAYTMAAASSFNGFSPTAKFYVCSVQPEYFEGLLASAGSGEEVDAP